MKKTILIFVISIFTVTIGMSQIILNGTGDEAFSGVDAPTVDDGTGALVTEDINPDYAHRTTPELIISETNNADSAYGVFSMDTYKYFSLDAIMTNTDASDTLWCYVTNDITLSQTDEAGWQLYGVQLFGTAFVIVGGAYQNNTPFAYEYVMLKWKGGDATNSVTVQLKKTY